MTELLDTVVDVPPDALPEARPTIERRGHSTMTNERLNPDSPESPDSVPVFIDVMGAFSLASLRLPPAVDAHTADEADDIEDAHEADAI